MSANPQPQQGRAKTSSHQWPTPLRLLLRLVCRLLLGVGVRGRGQPMASTAAAVCGARAAMGARLQLAGAEPLCVKTPPVGIIIHVCEPGRRLRAVPCCGAVRTMHTYPCSHAGTPVLGLTLHLRPCALSVLHLHLTAALSFFPPSSLLSLICVSRQPSILTPPPPPLPLTISCPPFQQRRRHRRPQRCPWILPWLRCATWSGAPAWPPYPTRFCAGGSKVSPSLWTAHAG